MKRIFSLILALMLLMSMSVTAFADVDEQAVEDFTLTIEGYKAGHTYEAYQIFSGTIVNGMLEGIQWGSGVNQATLSAALKTDNVLKGYFTSVDTTNAVAVAAAVSAWASNGDVLDSFADLVGKHLSATKTESTPATDSTTNYSFTLQPGYYLIKDQKQEGATLTDDFYTKFVIALASSTTAKVKGSIPTVKKEVSHNLENNYTDFITNQLEKTHFYQWVGTVNSDIADYTSYYYAFEDTLSTGLDFIRFEQIFIQHVGDVKTIIYDASKDDSKTTPNEGILKPELIPNTWENNGRTVKVVWNDLKAKFPALRPSDKIYIRYSAKLNENAVIGGSGNENEVYLEYSNEPNGTSHGKTEEDEARVYAFALEVLKQDEKDGRPIKDVEFVLFHYHSESGSDGATVNVPVYAILENGKLSGWTKDKAGATVLTSGADGKFSVSGLQANLDYYLEETKPATGYTTLAEPVEIMIKSYTLNGNEISSITYEVGSDAPATAQNASAGIISVTVKNKSGSILPSTGGMGTTLFYVAGGIMVLAAVVLLVTKKRMSGEK